MNSNKKGRKWLIVLVVVVVVFGAYYFLSKDNAAAAYNEETARTQDIVTYYTFSGNIEPKDISVIKATSPNKANTIYFEEGDLVAKEDAVLKAQSGSKYEADISGTITDIYVEKDDAFAAGTDLVRIADYANPIVSIKVDEYDLKAISVGMNVTVNVQALDKALTGTIIEIDKEATVTNGVAYYMTKVSIPQDGSLMMGLSCEVQVPKESAMMATTITMDAIQYDDDNKPFVYCYNRGEEIVTQDIVLGITNGSYVQVVDGVKSGETILLPKENTPMLMNAMRNAN